MNSSSILFLFALFLSPFYFFRSGLPQIADFVYVISVLPFFYNFKKFNFLLNTWPKTLVLFIIWVSIVSTFWFLNLGDPKFLMPLFYYLFNFIITATLLIFLIKDQNYLNKISHILFFNSVVVLITIVTKIGLYRNTGTFNNPNQLALFGIFLMSTIQLINDYNIPRKWKDLFIYFTGFLCILSSLSITAIASTPFFIICTVLKNRIKFSSLILSIILIFTPVFIINNLPNLGSRLLKRGERTVVKLERISEERGYKRIIDNPEYIIFGAGEGANEERFGYSQEIHSLPGNLLFSYGIFGISLFAYAMFLILNPIRLQDILLLLPLGIYSITHYSLRSTFVWILIAIFYFKNSTQKNA